MDYVVLVVEDEISEAVLRRLLLHSGREFVVHNCISSRGVGNIRRDLQRYMSACRSVPHIVLVDLDQFQCPPSLLADWRIVHKPESLLFRVAVREVEAWLLADADGLSQFLRVSTARIPAQPELESDPKRALINIARRSRSRRLAAEIVPIAGSVAPHGVLYNHHLCRFVRELWDVDTASTKSPSLARMIECLDSFMA